MCLIRVRAKLCRKVDLGARFEYPSLHENLFKYSCRLHAIYENKDKNNNKKDNNSATITITFTNGKEKLFSASAGDKNVHFTIMGGGL